LYCIAGEVEQVVKKKNSVNICVTYWCEFMVWERKNGPNNASCTYRTLHTNHNIV